MFVKERFFQKVREDESGCHLWMGARNIWGYGRHKVDGKTCAAHRTAWGLANGSIPEGLLVLHHCDNPCCVNPDHLYVGTQADNMRDMFARGRDPAKPKLFIMKPRPRPKPVSEPKIAKPRPIAQPKPEPIARSPKIPKPKIPRPEWLIDRRRHICARVTDELRSVLEEAAVQQTGGDISALVRSVVLDYAATWMTERTSNEIIPSRA
jgi:hypothetical protein